MKYILLFLLPIILLVSACKPSKQAAQNNPAVETQHEPQLIFLNYELHSDSITGIEKLELVNFILTKGKLKEDLKSKDPETGDLICTFTDADLKHLEHFTIADPLQVSVEYAGSNGQLAKKELRLAKAQFSIRAQLPEKTTYVIIEKIIPGGNSKKELLTSKITQ